MGQEPAGVWQDRWSPELGSTQKGAGDRGSATAADGAGSAVGGLGVGGVEDARGGQLVTTGLTHPPRWAAGTAASSSFSARSAMWQCLLALDPPWRSIVPTTGLSISPPFIPSFPLIPT